MSTSIAVVTGATGTLGRRLVRTLSARGLQVVAVSRSGDAPGEGETVAVAADVGSPTASRPSATLFPTAGSRRSSTPSGCRVRPASSRSTRRCSASPWT